MKVVGVDGCKQGWAAVALVDGTFADAAVASTFAEVLAEYRDATIVAVDIPIGLPDQEPRPADLAARKMLGARASTIFLVPPRFAMVVASYAEALAQCRTFRVAGLSRQAYALRDKILEVDALVTADDRVFEVHPEVSFAALARELGRPSILPPKKTWNGLAVRLRLLGDIGIVIPEDLGAGGLAGADDVVDAAVAAWSAVRIANRTGVSLPVEPGRDERGRVVAIWY